MPRSRREGSPRYLNLGLADRKKIEPSFEVRVGRRLDVRGAEAALGPALRVEQGRHERLAVVYQVVQGPYLTLR